MAYGRLDIYWPDGQFESHLLDSPTVSVGRAPGNTITLDTNTVSRYHFSLTYEADTVTINDMDSENGTFVDGVRVEANQPMPLAGVAEIQMGHLRMIYQPVDDSPTMPMSAAGEEDTQRITRDETAFVLDVDLSQLDVWPAASGSAELSITNTGDSPITVAIQMIGIPDEWIRITQTQLTVEPDTTDYVLIKIEPPRRPDVLPTTYHSSIQVIPLDAPETMLEAPIDIHMHGYSGFGVALSSKHTASDGTLRLFLHNQGSEPLPLTVRGTDAGDKLRFVLPEAPILLEAGQRLQMQVRVEPRRRPLTGGSIPHDFDLRVHAENAAGFVAAVRAKTEIAPMFPLWALISASGIVFSVVVIVLLGLLGVLSPPPEPIIYSMSVNQAQVEQGMPIVVQWEADEVATFRIRVNQTPVAELEGDARQYTLDTGAYEGDIAVELLAENQGSYINYGLPVNVYRPLRIEAFTITPAELVRNVVANLEIAWHIPDATETRLSGLSDFTNQLIPATFSAEDSLSVSGIPSEPLRLVLRARDANGDILEETRIIPVIDPMCTALSDVPLREGPDAAYQTVSTVPEGVSVMVMARDGNAGWLQMQLPGDVRGWGSQDAFTCDASFNLQSLRQEFNVPPPPATLTPVPETTPEATPEVTDEPNR